jgi:hypothetical protein
MRWIAAVLALAACPTSNPCPGDEQMGSYTFRTEELARENCFLAEIPDASFEFTVKFCRFRDGGDAFASIGGVPHPATWDGGTITATYSARRSFSECSCFTSPDPSTRQLGTLIMTETISVALLSKSQNDAVGGDCSMPLLADAGVTPPGTVEGGGFDAVRACGTLTETTTVNPKPTAETEMDMSCKLDCDRCKLTYGISGDRGDSK